MEPSAPTGSAAASSSSAPAEKKKRKRVDLSKFADLEAEEVGGSAEEEDEGIDEEFIDDVGVKDSDAARSKLRKKMNLDKELKEIQKDMASRGPLAGAARLFSTDRLDDMERRYKEMEELGKRGEDISKMEVLESVEQTVTVPESKDPRLWCLKTFGPEQELCIKLMWKAFETIRNGESVPVASVFTVPYVRGYIYLEAQREADVRRFTKGINGLSQYTGLSLVPIDQMAGVFSAAKAAAQKVNVIRPGDWVRLKKGPYGGDLAQVDEVDDDMYLLKMKPRIRGGQIAKGNKKIFPPKWFHKDDMEATREVIVNVEPRKTQKGFKLFYVAHGEAYRDGFLYKNYRSTAFVSGSDVRPTEHELTDWRNAPPISEQVRPEDDLPKSKEEEEEKMPPPPLPVKKDTGPILQDGERVIVHSGDLKNLRGVVSKAVFGSPTVLVQPRDVDVKGDLSISTTRLCKYFEIGDYVTVLSGDHKGDAGHVEKVDLGPQNEWGSHVTAHILASDYTSFRTSLNDLQKSFERPETRRSNGDFAVGQLVSVGKDTRALIVRLEADDRALVLDIDGVKQYLTLKELEPFQVPKRSIYKQEVFCEDKTRNKIVPFCIVKAPQSYTGSAPVTSEVLYIEKNRVFLRAVEGLVGERAYLVAHGDKCEFVWDPSHMPKGKGKGRRPDLKLAMKLAETPEAELTSRPMSFGIQMASQISFLKAGWHKMLGLSERPAGAPTGDTLVPGSAVKITGGNYKGLRGEIRDFLEDRVRISLLSAPKLVEVSINDVQDDLYSKDKASRKFVDFYTPRDAPMPVPTKEKSEEQTLAEGLDRATMPSDEQAWDPKWLVGDDSAPITPAVSIVSSSRRRRAPRLAAELMAETGPANGS